MKEFNKIIDGFFAKYKNKKLKRSSKNYWLGGVIGGLGKFFDTSPDLLRIILIIIFCLPGGEVLIFPYFLFWIFTPEDDD